MSRELLASQKNNSGILLDPRTKLAVLITIAVFILGGSYEGIMQYYIIVLAAIPLLLLSAARKWKGAVLYILIFGGSLCLEMFGLSRLTGVANYIAVFLQSPSNDLPATRSTASTIRASSGSLASGFSSKKRISTHCRLTANL